MRNSTKGKVSHKSLDHLRPHGHRCGDLLRRLRLRSCLPRLGLHPRDEPKDRGKSEAEGRGGTLHPGEADAAENNADPELEAHTGKELSVAEVVERLTETLKEARKAVDRYNVKTFQLMMNDKRRKPEEKHV